MRDGKNEKKEIDVSKKEIYVRKRESSRERNWVQLLQCWTNESEGEKMPIIWVMKGWFVRTVLCEWNGKKVRKEEKREK